MEERVENNPVTTYICGVCRREHKNPEVIKHCEQHHVQRECEHPEFVFREDTSRHDDAAAIQKICAVCGKKVKSKVIYPDELSPELLETIFNTLED